ncbi:hypothetical protein [Jiella avicenniae]|uniref:Uncharacterized protein n=1 Tax=Jiella avicenniae TaxID=2907202 RepID=A0A9X1TC69_9HYPH|nr:hypothetical protein [Jiella avicenniae]MCE7027726.1 hypothetical protein [Jiella avicenniae]MCE7028768.1 hypothetical protein [Jiella avicenniae]
MGMGRDLLKEGRYRVKGHEGWTTERGAPAPDEVDELDEVKREDEWPGHHAVPGDQCHAVIRHGRDSIDRAWRVNKVSEKALLFSFLMAFSQERP